MTDLEKIEAILRHMKMVESHMQRLAKKLLKEDPDKYAYLSRVLLIRSREHDLSKLSSPEFESLWSEEPGFQEALQHHRSKNRHHPEFHQSIHKMSRADIAEMVCDWLARSNEFGTGFKEWVNHKATVRYGFTMEDKVGQRIEYFMNLLLVEAFT